MKNFKEKRTILMLTPFLPYKPKHGAQTVMWNRLKVLLQEYDVILLTFLDNEKQLGYLPELKLCCKDVFAFLCAADRVGFIQRLIYPGPIRKCHSNANFKNKLLEILENYPIDLVLIETSFMIQYVDYIKDIPVILEEHDASILSMWNSFERRINHNFMHNFFDWIRNCIYLQHYYKKFDKIIVFTEPDAKLLWRVNSHLDISVIPPSLNFELFEKDKEYEKDIDILFVGHFKHYPNIDGLRYFFKKIYPLLKQKLSNFTFKIVGSGIKREEFVKLFKIDSRDKNIEFIGEVEEYDKVIEYLFRTKVFIAPIRIGGGVKIKLLEALAVGLPIITTSKAIEGLNIHPGRDVLIADSPVTFCKDIITILQNNRLRLDRCNKIKESKVCNYDNSVIGSLYLDLFSETLKNANRFLKSS